MSDDQPIIPPATEADLPELPADLGIDFSALDPSAIIDRPQVAEELTLASVQPLRMWFKHAVDESEMMAPEVIDQSVAMYVDWHRDHGIDMLDPTTLLTTMFGTMVLALDLQRSAGNCQAGEQAIYHTLSHVNGPLLNVCLIYERLISQVFPDAPEGGE